MESFGVPSGVTALDLAWHDATKLMADHRTRALADQLYRAVGSISANIAEGYSRNTGRDRARFYEYALGSARESRDWYYKARHILDEVVTTHRIEMLAEIIKLLLSMIPQQRKQNKIISENSEVYPDYSKEISSENEDTLPT